MLWCCRTGPPAQGRPAERSGLLLVVCQLSARPGGSRWKATKLGPCATAAGSALTLTSYFPFCACGAQPVQGGAGEEVERARPHWACLWPKLGKGAHLWTAVV